MPKIETVTRLFPELEGFDFPGYCQTIREEFDSLPKESSATRILRLQSEKYISEIEAGDLDPQDGCFQISMLLGYAKIYNQRVSNITQLGSNGFYLEDNYGWDKKKEAEEIIHGYEEGQRRFENNLPVDLRIFGIGPITLYFKKNLGSNVSTITEDVDFVLRGPIAVVPFDHFTSERDFVGKVCHYPSNFDRSAFKYVKAMGFPPLVFYSDRPENDFYSYAYKIKEADGFDSIEQVIATTGGHELAHYRLIDFAIGLIKVGKEHSWLTEAVAQYYGETNWPKTKILKIPFDYSSDIFEIVKPVNGQINYEKSLLLFLALGAKKAYKAGLISKGDTLDQVVTQGVKHIIYELTKYTLAVVNGQSPKLTTSIDLLYLIDPELRQPENIEIFRDYLEGVSGYYKLIGQGIDPKITV